MKHASFIAALAAVAALAAPTSFAQTGGHGHAMAPTGPIAQATKSTMADGEVRKVDRVKGTVTLKHGPLPVLGMGPMTMMFTATDPKMLANVKEGDKVRFEAGQGKDGTLTVTRLEVVR
jgi:Cu/Ag efflux protein CusF